MSDEATPVAPEPEAASLLEILGRLATAGGLDDEARSILWGACDGDAALAAALAGEAVAPPTHSGIRRATPVWLSSVAVEGFRGIGPRAELLLDPKPGLTLVVGRNGSGKSSFAEALEALLTGDNLRWRNRPKPWQDGWRNLHHDGPTVVVAEIQIEGDGDGLVELERRWGAAFDDSTLARGPGRHSVTADELGWAEALANHKPFLSYNELGTMLEQNPSVIYDSMAAVLGLDRLTEARERLRQARLALEKPAKEVERHRRALLDDLDAAAGSPAIGLPAGEARAALAARNRDLDRLEALAIGPPGTDGDRLASLAELPALDVSACRAAATSLRTALAERNRLAGTDAARSDRVASLLRQALDVHNHDGDGRCPVCGSGFLDAAWRARASDEVVAMETRAAELRLADGALASAESQAGKLLLPLPDALAIGQEQEGLSRDETLADLVAATRLRWQALVVPPPTGWTPDDLAARLDAVDEIARLADEVRSAASDDVAARQAAWRPLAGRLSGWVAAARDAERSSSAAARAGRVEDFLKDAEAEMRAERFRPIAERSAALWAQLRQQSNVSLARVALEGRVTSRRVELDVTVDGAATSALGVMSQGELHALALALFLPRVTAPESPFRFLVIDDPVQAMDPARVDGLAGVLAAIGRDRQVIVFTHDDRLPASCRRLGIAAEIIEVSRQVESRVTARSAPGPAERALNDARVLATTQRLPEPLKRQIVPVHCRRALEAQARDLIWSRLLAAGRTPVEIDGLLDDTSKTSSLLGLLLFGRPDVAPADVRRRLDALGHGMGRRLQVLNQAVHEGSAQPFDPEDLVRQTGTLMQALRVWAA